MMNGLVKPQGTRMNPDVEVNCCVKGQGTFQVRLLEVDKRMKLLNGNKDQEGSTNLMGKREIPDASASVTQGRMEM